ncbi:MAG: SDR family NAD(P)-dependent oxidoreductase [Holophaga sp.]|nr:SDR family NAD(P)-dependent oxidoreductase [Holophaga sp.]
MAKPLAVIVGAGPGIGLAVARRFRLGGFALAVVSRPADPLAEFQAALEGPEAGAALVLGADLAREQQLRGALAAIEAWAGHPEVLVYNASAGAPGPAADLDPARLSADLQVSVGSALAAARWALPAMRRAGRGTLLFTGGGLALGPQAGLAAASLGKAALRSLALSLGQELAPEGIHAATVTVCGFVQPDTRFAPDLIAQVFWDLYLQKQDGWETERILR